VASRFQRRCFRTGFERPVVPTLRTKRGLALLLLPLLAPLLVRSAPAARQPAPTPRELVIGQSAPFSGPSAQTARDYQEGLLAWFADVNRRGGIHGRRLRLVSLDDRYDPQLTLRNTRQLVEQQQAIALIGYFGTANSKAILPLVEQVGIPYVAPRTGAKAVLKPFRPMVFNLRASYQAEIDRVIDQLVRDGRHQVAVVHITDAYGEDGLRSSQVALARHGLRPVVIAGVQRNATNTDAAARKVVAAQANAVLVIATFTTSASLTRDLSRLGSRAQLMNLSPVGIEGLQDALPGGQANGIGISQVVPFPWNRRVPVVAQYQQLMQRQQTEARYGYTSLEGFLAARWLTAALEKAGPDPTRARVVGAFRSLTALDLGGFKLQLGPGDNQASDLVELTFLGSQRWGP
jgi:branched-chain amino acid transport system substrate-binding protein